MSLWWREHSVVGIRVWVHLEVDQDSGATRALLWDSGLKVLVDSEEIGRPCVGVRSRALDKTRVTS